jgi:V-type H+-transporting ATPase subunit a
MHLVQQEGGESIVLEEVPSQGMKPPTLIYTNAFTQVFQEIVDTYGVPSYKEINPAYFTTVTFPFLFSIMFGDIGHGSVLLIVGVLLCLLHSCLSPRLPNLAVVFKLRYLLLLLGIFSTFTGFIYNDLMVIPVYLFPSCYDEKTLAFNS